MTELTNEFLRSSLTDAYSILADKRLDAAKGSMRLWQFVNNAQKHIERQLDELDAPILDDSDLGGNALNEPLAVHIGAGTKAAEKAGQ